MRTRDYILKCPLLLFSEQGKSNVSILEIVDELGISPGNLYYHFHSKGPLVMVLFERPQAELTPLLDPSEEVHLDAEDYQLFLHLIVECLIHYRFLFQNLFSLTGRLPRLARGIRTWFGALKRTLVTLLAHLKTD